MNPPDFCGGFQQTINVPTPEVSAVTEFDKFPGQEVTEELPSPALRHITALSPAQAINSINDPLIGKKRAEFDTTRSVDHLRWEGISKRLGTPSAFSWINRGRRPQKHITSPTTEEHLDSLTAAGFGHQTILFMIERQQIGNL
ncbi:MAG: hypothetical protein ACK5CW_12285, partial [Verrucomicrobiota bacterium]